ncbi:MAG: ferritin-like domain-containing protein [Sciscionella sp.]
MLDNSFLANAINRSAENATDRRRFLRSAGATSLGALGATVLGAGMLGAGTADAAEDSGPSDAAVLNFALNLEYLEAEFYQRAVNGHGLPDNLTTGKYTRGGVTGGRAVHFTTKAARQYAEEIAGDELAHVKFLRTALGSATVARPKIDLKQSFTAAAQAAGLIQKGQTFDPYANENNFLLAAFIFEDVGVTAYKGAAPLVRNKTYLEAAAGILAVEAYHASNIRTTLYQRDLIAETKAISDARDSLDGSADLDQGITTGNRANIVPADKNGVAYSRTASQVLNVVYLTPQKATKGGFFPNGVNVMINTSG